MDTKKLRQKILDLAIRGKLVPQDPNDEPASVLLERIKAEKERLIKEGKIKRSKKSASDTSHYENLPFEIPESWVWTTIDELFFVTKLAGFEYTEYFTKENVNIEFDIPIVRAQNVRMGRFVENQSEAIKIELSELLNRSSLTIPCLLMTFIGAGVGDTCIFPALKRNHLAPNVAKMEPYFNKLNLDYFLQVCMSSCGQEEVNKIKKSTAQPSLSMATIRSIRVPMPPIQEQIRIANATNYWLGVVDRIEYNKKDISNTIEQVKNKILSLAITGKLVKQIPSDEPAIELLKRINPTIQIPCDNPHYPFDIPQSWCWIKLGALCSFLSRGKSPKYSEERKYPVFAQKCNLYNGDISLEQARFLDPSTLSKWDDIYKLREGDVLMNSTGTGTVGRTRVFHSDCLGTYPFAVPDSHVSVIRTFDSIESKYIHAYLSSKETQRFLEDNLAGSTNQKELYIGILDNLLISLPPQNEQKRIVEEIDRYFNTLDKIKESLTA